MEKSSLGRYHKDTSRNEISIDTLKKKDVKLPKERMVPNKPSALQSLMMAQSTKKKQFAFRQHTLDKDHKVSVLRKRIAPPSIVHYREFAFEYKKHKMGSPLSLYQKKKTLDTLKK